MNIDIEITLIKELSDILCYVYSNSELLDVVSASNEAMIISIPDSLERISLVAKDVITGEIVFKEDFCTQDLLWRTHLIPVENPLLFIQARNTLDLSPKKTQKKLVFSSFDEEFEDLDEIKQKEYNFWKEFLSTKAKNKKNMIDEVQQLIKTHLESVKFNILKNNSPFFAISSEIGNFQKEINEKEEKFVSKKNSFTQDIYRQNMEITKLKADNKILYLDLDSCKNELKLQKFKNQADKNSEMSIKMHLLSSLLEDKTRELITSKILQLEIQKQLKALKENSDKLQRYFLYIKSNNKEL